MKHNPVKKKDVKTNAELKTVADYALVLHHVNGFDRDEARQNALKSKGEPLFEELLKRNIELFTTGDIVLMP